MAVSLAAELLEDFEPEIDHICLVPSEGGRFEVVVNGKLLYSKLTTGRHANSGEVKTLVKTYLQEKH
ncbi:MAG: Rdx family protein [Leptolinea sp.]